MLLLVRLVGLAVALVATAAPLGAQHSRTVSGRVLLQQGSRAVPVGNRMVTLHRVGSDSAGAVDSVLSDVRGNYSFTFRPFGAERAVYFAAALHGGVAYFTAPLGAAATEGESAEITVFDTTSSGVDIAVRGRHLAISAPSVAGSRAVVDVFELGNDSTRTLVQGRDAQGAMRATWRIVLPEGAENATVMRDAGDIAGAAVVIADGAASIYAPFAPGLKQLALRYEFPPTADSLTIPLLDKTGVLEVLFEETAARASGAGLTARGAVTVEGKSLQRFLAQDVAQNAVLTITLPRARAPMSNRTWMMALLGALIAAVVAAVLVLSGRSSTRSQTS